MPERTNVAFGYDPVPFQKGIQQNIRAMGELTKHVGRIAGQIAFKLLGLGIAVKGVQFLWNKFRQGAPEISRAFSMASDIIFKNFFWPLRKALLPILQQLLDWVREHRTLFVSWGSIVVNVFKTVWSVVKAVWGIVKGLVEALFPSLKKGNQAFLDAINLVLAKIAFVATFITNVLGDLIRALGPSLHDVLQDVVALAREIAKIGWEVIKGIFDSIKTYGPGLVEAIHGLFQAFGELLSLFTGNADAMSGLREAVKFLSSAPILAATFFIDALRIAINALVDAIKLLKGEKVDWNNLLPHGPAIKGIENLVNTIIGKIGEEWNRAPWYEKAGMIAAAPIAAPVVGAAAMIAPSLVGGMAALGNAIPQYKGPAKTEHNFNVQLNITEGNARFAGNQFAAGMYDRVREQRVAGGH